MSEPPESPSVNLPTILVSCLSILIVLFLGVPAFWNYCSPLPRRVEPNKVDLSPLLELNLPNDEEKIDRLVDREALEQLDRVFIAEKGKPLNYDYARNFSYDAGAAPHQDIRLSTSIQAWKATEEQSAEERAELDRSACLGAETSKKGESNGISYSYCIFRLTESRGHGPHMTCRYSSDRFTSRIYIQKGNINIRISEYTNTLDREPINQAIEQIADLFIEMTD